MPQQLDRENLEKLPPEKLVEMVLKLQELVLKQNEMIERLQGYVEKDSKTSSKPPSSDLLKKSEKAKEEVEKASRPGRQKGHEGKTRKGFGRIDRIESVKIEKCLVCGGSHLEKSGRWEQSHVVSCHYFKCKKDGVKNYRLCLAPNAKTLIGKEI